MLAGGRPAANDNYYLYTGQYYWALSPSGFDNYDAYGFYVNSNGNLNNRSVYYSYGARPSIVLSKGTRYSSGDGTVYYPYVIEEE